MTPGKGEASPQVDAAAVADYAGSSTTGHPAGSLGHSPVPVPVPMQAPPLVDLRFVVLSGKGGVGRTTVAAVLARAAHARGKRVLVAQTDAAERLARMLGHPGVIGPAVRTILPGLDVVNMTPRESIHQYALLVLKYEAVYRALFENRSVRGFLSAVPGLDAYAMLGKAWWHTTETYDHRGPEHGRLKYDLVILDGPASGHAITMLKIPSAILSTMPAGPLAKDARALTTLLADPLQSAFVIVTRPEDLPARETAELALAARALPALALGPLIVDCVPQHSLSAPGVASALHRMQSSGRTGDAALDSALALAAWQNAQVDAARVILEQLAGNPGLPMIHLPALSRTSLGLDDIDLLARYLAPVAARP